MSMSSDANQVDLLTFALSEQRTIMTDPTNSVTVELTGDGSIKAIRLSEAGHRMGAAMVAELVISLHTAGLAQAQQAIEAALSGDMGLSESGSSDLPADPRAVPSADVVSANNVAAVEASRPFGVSQTAPESTNPPPWPVPMERGVQERTVTSPPPAPVPSSPTDREQQPCNASSPAARRTDERGDEDEYYRNFSVFEHDDHRPRG
ncbi:hypothetical protein [Nocardia camponoti]|uniref:Uncharacterized protein n=1 Tax=Nocardia camponoti TaxID=1616106 RepID=A0A917QPX2_9NOCA|nr:hypothetical protein [Nocardia camponoti]GGK63003.1 hypothetical protein GCM10011591_39060 [Nocardia camponoti]